MKYSLLLKILEMLTLLIGIGCVILSISIAYKFKKVNLPIARALAFQLLAEGFIGAVTVVFSLTSFLGMYKALNPEIVILMRWLIFGAGAITSVNLWKNVKEIEGRK